MPDNSEPKGAMETPSAEDMPTVKDRPVLLASVIVMGVLLVVGFVVVFGTIIYRVMQSPDAAAPVAVRGQFDPVDVTVADGTSVVSTTFTEDRLSIVTMSRGSLEVIIVDTKRGAELGRVRLIGDGVTQNLAEPPAAEGAAE